jgi:hypothetical protein
MFECNIVGCYLLSALSTICLSWDGICNIRVDLVTAVSHYESYGGFEFKWGHSYVSNVCGWKNKGSLK